MEDGKDFHIVVAEGGEPRSTQSKLTAYIALKSFEASPAHVHGTLDYIADFCFQSAKTNPYIFQQALPS
jgi:hypothetical protein